MIAALLILASFVAAMALLSLRIVALGRQMVILDRCISAMLRSPEKAPEIARHARFVLREKGFHRE